MSVLANPLMQFEDANGLPYALATAQFYLHDSSTPATIYANDSLSVTQTNPVTADSKGLFPAVYLDPAVQYRMVLKNDGGSITIADIDPINSLLLIVASQIADGAIEAKLGYTPVDPAAAIFTGPPRYVPSVTPAVLHGDELGFRASPRITKDVNYAFTLDDAGKLFYHDDASNYVYTIPTNASVAFPIGTVLYMYTASTGTTTLHPDTGVHLLTSGSATDGDIVGARYYLYSIRKVDTNTWIAKA